jgi:hypothetical protein
LFLYELMKKKYSITINNLFNIEMHRIGPCLDKLKIDREFRIRRMYRSMLNDMHHAMVVFAFSLLIKLTGATSHHLHVNM